MARLRAAAKHFHFSVVFRPALGFIYPPIQREIVEILPLVKQPIDETDYRSYSADMDLSLQFILRVHDTYEMLYLLCL